jgi:hypothetical protein
MKKAILITIIVLILVISGGVTVYANKDSEIFDTLFPENIKEERYIKRIERLFPEKIGDYEIYIYGGSDNKIRNQNECENLPGAEVCLTELTAEYRQNNGNNIVFVIISKITKDKEAYLKFLKENSFQSVLNNYKVMRLEKHEIYWLPASDKIDSIGTQEGTFVKNDGGGESYNYASLATGDNIVTQYFIKNYPPIAENK